jgi:ketosteroid isomerase-like protein
MRKIKIAIIFLQIVCFGCQSKTENQHRKLISKYYEIFNAHDWKKLSEMYAPIAEFKDPSLGIDKVNQSREQFVAKYSELNQMIPDVQDTILSVYESGKNNVIVEFVSTGTGPDGKKFKLPICTIFEIKEGLITKDYTYYNNQ